MWRALSHAATFFSTPSTAGRLGAAHAAAAPALEAVLELPQALPALGDFAQQRLRLGGEQVLVVGDEHGALRAEYGANGAPGAHARESVAVERAQLAGGRLEQVGMLGGHQRANEAIGALGDRLEVVLGVVALVEHQRDVFGGAADVAVARGECVGQAGEGGRVGGVTGIGAVQQWQVGVGGDEQRETDDAQVAAFLAVAALGEGGTGVEGIDEGEEVGGVEQHAPRVDIELAHQAGDEVALDRLDGLARDAVHVVPEALAAELARLDVEQAVEDGVVEPLGDAGLGTGGDAPVEGGDQQVGADGGAGAALGDMAVDVLDEAQALGEAEECGDGAELAHEGGRGLGVGVAAHGGEDVVGSAEVFLPDDLGFAVDALALAGVVVGFAADGFFDDADHDC